MVWPTLGSRTAKEQNSWYTQNPSTCHSQDYFDALLSYLHGLIDRVSCINLGINWDQESTVFFLMFRRLQRRCLGDQTRRFRVGS